MKARLCLVVAGVIASVGCSGSSSGGDGVDAADSSDPAVQIAALATGDLTPSSNDVETWRSRLGVLQTYCTGTERDVSDIVVQARKVAEEHGASVSYDDAAIGITREASARSVTLPNGGQNQDCDKLAIDWVTSVATK